MMATIEDLPDDPKYTIKSVSTQTGIRPVTLRAWERRYELLSPHRYIQSEMWLFYSG
jgi:hypothetical protein